jgi:hypothetical protein
MKHSLHYIIYILFVCNIIFSQNITNKTVYPTGLKFSRKMVLNTKFRSKIIDSSDYNKIDLKIKLSASFKVVSHSDTGFQLEMRYNELSYIPYDKITKRLDTISSNKLDNGLYSIYLNKIKGKVINIFLSKSNKVTEIKGFSVHLDSLDLSLKYRFTQEDMRYSKMYINYYFGNILIKSMFELDINEYSPLFFYYEWVSDARIEATNLKSETKHKGHGFLSNKFSLTKKIVLNNSQTIIPSYVMGFSKAHFSKLDFLLCKFRSCANTVIFSESNNDQVLSTVKTRIRLKSTNDK